MQCRVCYYPLQSPLFVPFLMQCPTKCIPCHQFVSILVAIHMFSPNFYIMGMHEVVDGVGQIEVDAQSRRWSHCVVAT